MMVMVAGLVLAMMLIALFTWQAWGAEVTPNREGASDGGSQERDAREPEGGSLPQRYHFADLRSEALFGPRSAPTWQPTSPSRLGWSSHSQSLRLRRSMLTQLNDFTHPIRPDPEAPDGTGPMGDPTQGGDRPRTVRANVPGRAPGDDNLRSEVTAARSPSEPLRDGARFRDGGPEADRPVRAVDDNTSRQRSSGVEDYVRRHPIHGVLTAMAAGVVLGRVLKK